jgi:hypothetical protein
VTAVVALIHAGLPRQLHPLATTMLTLAATAFALGVVATHLG